jgi:antitoxin component of MazEF toxin-antitoxin module
MSGIDFSSDVITVITMKSVVKVTRIGNSKGIRLKKELLEKYGIEDSVVLEEAADYLILKPVKRDKLTWEESYQQMVAEDEDWSDWDAVGEEGWPHED